MHISKYGNVWLASSVVAVAVAALPGEALAQAKSFDIPAQPLTVAMGVFARQAHIQIVAPRRVTEGKNANSVRGDMTVATALARLLAGTGLAARETGPQTYAVISTAIDAGHADKRLVTASLEQSPPTMAPGTTNAAPAPALAQDGVADEEAVKPLSSGDIIVTAQRRSESLQKVPIAVTAISPLVVDRLGLQDVKSLQKVTPGLVYTTNINYVQTYIRGVGSNFTNPGLESAVATYVDGAYIERGFGTLFDVLDPGSIQVLKGPQGTLWGRNATGGAVVINTADPELTSSGRALVQKGSIGHSLVEGVGNLALSDTVALRVAARYREEGGYVRNLPDNFMFGAQTGTTARAKLLFKPTSEITSVLQFQYDYSKRAPEPQQQDVSGVFCATCSLSTYQYPTSGGFTTATNVVNGGVGGLDHTYFLDWRTGYEGASASVNLNIGYRKSDNMQTGDFDLTDQNGLNIMQYSGAKTLTGEISVASKWAGMLNLIGGISYLKDRCCQVKNHRSLLGNGDETRFLQAPPFLAGDDPTGGLALFPFHHQPSRRRGHAGRARDRCQLRDRALLGQQVRPGDRGQHPPGPWTCRQCLASRRDGGPDRRQADVHVAGCRQGR